MKRQYIIHIMTYCSHAVRVHTSTVSIHPSEQCATIITSHERNSSSNIQYC